MTEGIATDDVDCFPGPGGEVSSKLAAIDRAHAIPQIENLLGIAVADGLAKGSYVWQTIDLDVLLQPRMALLLGLKSDDALHLLRQQNGIKAVMGANVIHNILRAALPQATGANAAS